MSSYIYYYQKQFFSSPPPDSRNFLCGGSVDLFWNDPFSKDGLNITMAYKKPFDHRGPITEMASSSKFSLQY
jgi:hypothetical protein